MIKGGGAALTRVTAAMSEKFVCIADESKLADPGRFPLPVEVIPVASTIICAALPCWAGKPACV